MSKLMTVLALAAMMTVVGCKKDKEPTPSSSEPKKMSASGGTGCPSGECSKSK